jgi:hypothetical protein
MRNRLVVCVAMAVAILVSADTAARADATLAYSFETIVPTGQGAPPTGPDGFFGAGATVSQDTIGATHGSFSMKYDVGVGGFVGARTETVIPLALNNPPGVKYVLFDVNIPAAFAGTFAVIGISGFGHDLDNASFGNPFQFADEENIHLAPGQYRDLRINLDTDLFSGQSFNDRFGDDTNDLDVVSQFQLYMNKNALNPFTVYIDNVRLVVPEPATFGLLGIGAVVLGGMRRRRSR